MKDNKNCFIVTPIGNNDSNTRRSTDGLINTVIRPLLENEFKFKSIVAAHEINASGSINNQIMKRLIYDDLVIANLSTVNPNVMYEVAVRHATLKPIIHICEEGTKLPFDIIDQRTIFYKNDMLGVKELRDELILMIRQALKEEKFVDNPIYNATQSKIFIDSISDNPDKNFEKYLLERFESLESKLTGLKNIDSKKAKKISEPFLIKIITLTKPDLSAFATELRSSLSYENWDLAFFIPNESVKNNEDRYETSFNIIVESEKLPAFNTEIKEMIERFNFAKILNVQVEGNEIPF